MPLFYATTDWDEAFVFHQTQKLGLHSGIAGFDVVQENRASSGRLNQAGAGTVSACESPL